MALHHAAPGEIVDLCPAQGNLKEARTAALVKTKAFEAVRIVLQAGAQLPVHHVAGEITLQCLIGRVRLTVEDQNLDLSPGQWVYLAGGAPHAVQATDNSVLLLTILLHTSGAE